MLKESSAIQPDHEIFVLPRNKLSRLGEFKVFHNNKLLQDLTNYNKNSVEDSDMENELTFYVASYLINHYITSMILTVTKLEILLGIHFRG